jgi:hypothetical protein
MNNNPYLQYRHSEGLGDIIACTLHSKILSPITNFITGSNEICSACNKRRQALNYIFPIPVWKIFFENYNKKNEDLEKYFDLKNEENSEEISIEDKEHEELVIEESNKNIPEYNILTESTSVFDDYLFKLIIYKKK